MPVKNAPGLPDTSPFYHVFPCSPYRKVWNPKIFNMIRWIAGSMVWWSKYYSASQITGVPPLLMPHSIWHVHLMNWNWVPMWLQKVHTPIMLSTCLLRTEFVRYDATLRTTRRQYRPNDHDLDSLSWAQAKSKPPTLKFRIKLEEILSFFGCFFLQHVLIWDFLFIKSSPALLISRKKIPPKVSKSQDRCTRIFCTTFHNPHFLQKCLIFSWFIIFQNRVAAESQKLCSGWCF